MHGDHRQAEEASGADGKWVQLQWGQLRGGIWSTGTWPTHAGQVNIITSIRTCHFYSIVNVFLYREHRVPLHKFAHLYCIFTKRLQNISFGFGVVVWALWKERGGFLQFCHVAEASIRRISKWLPARSSLPPWLNSELPRCFSLAWGWCLSCAGSTCPPGPNFWGLQVCGLPTPAVAAGVSANQPMTSLSSPGTLSLMIFHDMDYHPHYLDPAVLPSQYLTPTHPFSHRWGLLE